MEIPQQEEFVDAMHLLLGYLGSERVVAPRIAHEHSFDNELAEAHEKAIPVVSPSESQQVPPDAPGV